MGEHASAELVPWPFVAEELVFLAPHGDSSGKGGSVTRPSTVIHPPLNLNATINPTVVTQEGCCNNNDDNIITLVLALPTPHQ